MYNFSFVKTTENDVTMYQDENRAISENTIFEVVDDYGEVQRRQKVASMANVARTGLSFRNPVSFMSNVETSQKVVEYETEAVIEKLVRHPNTAPYLAQRFGISNPTPRYLQVIADTFSSGKYVYADGGSINITYGKGKYGDLAATIASLLLNRKARNVLLDNDPAHGGIREVRNFDHLQFTCCQSSLSNFDCLCVLLSLFCSR